MAIDVTGQRFGRLIAVRPTGEVRNRVHMWLCQCDCGNETIVRVSYLRFGKTKSCGCLQRKSASELGKAKATHGHARPGNKSDTYKIWCDMKKRCNNPNQKTYHHYGGRGIQVCQQWNDSFESFLADMGERPSPSHTLERLDSNGNYEPSNCIWATWTEQQRNKSNNHLIEFNGKTQCMSEWAEELGMSIQALSNRINTHGWSIERALTEPLNR